MLKQGVPEEKIWMSFERKMSCAVGKCGHCRIDEVYVCLDGPVFNYPPVSYTHLDVYKRQVFNNMPEQPCVAPTGAGILDLQVIFYRALHLETLDARIWSCYSGNA